MLSRPLMKTRSEQISSPFVFFCLLVLLPRPIQYSIMGDSKRHSRLSQVVARLDSFGHEKPNMGNRKKLGLFTSPVLAEDEKPRLETLGENASDSIPIAGDGLPEFRRVSFFNTALIFLCLMVSNTRFFGRPRNQLC